MTIIIFFYLLVENLILIKYTAIRMMEESPSNIILCMCVNFAAFFDRLTNMGGSGYSTA